MKEENENEEFEEEMKIEDEKSPMTDLEAMAQQGYVIMGKIGQGSFGEVYEARDNDGTKLACKIVDTAANHNAEKSVARELEFLAEIGHPNVIKACAALQRGTRVFLFTEFAENGDLLKFISEYGSAPEPMAKKLFRQVATAVRYLHGLGIAHRDLKCENILLTGSFDAVLADFGSACRFEKNTLNTEFGCGAMAYEAPEVVSDTPYDPAAADVWSLGVVLYVTLNAAMPFDDSTQQRILRQQLGRRIVFRPELGDEVSVEARSLVRRILEPDTARRPGLDGVLQDPWLSPPTLSNHSLHQLWPQPDRARDPVQMDI